MSALPLTGYVYFDPNFQFPDGPTGEKLFVVLGESLKKKNCVVVARTTSKAKSDEKYGCFPEADPHCFFLPAAETSLHEDTWVLFDYVVTYEISDFDRWNRKTELTISQTKDLLNCGSQGIHISGYNAKMMRKEADSL